MSITGYSRAKPVQPDIYRHFSGPSPEFQFALLHPGVRAAPCQPLLSTFCCPALINAQAARDHRTLRDSWEVKKGTGKHLGKRAENYPRWLHIQGVGSGFLDFCPLRELQLADRTGQSDLQPCPTVSMRLCALPEALASNRAQDAWGHPSWATCGPSEGNFLPRAPYGYWAPHLRLLPLIPRQSLSLQAYDVEVAIWGSLTSPVPLPYIPRGCGATVPLRCLSSLLLCGGGGL